MPDVKTGAKSGVKMPLGPVKTGPGYRSEREASTVGLPGNDPT